LTITTTGKFCNPLTRSAGKAKLSIMFPHLEKSSGVHAAPPP
jgi:hypothetical protein